MLSLHHLFSENENILQMLMLSKLSTKLIRPLELQSILEKVEANLDINQRLIFSPHNYFIYYKISKIHVSGYVNDVFSAWFDIRTYSLLHKVQVYKGTPIPVYDKTLDRYSRLRLDENILITTTDNEHYAVMTETEFRDKKYHNTLENDFPLINSNVPNCLAHAFFRDKVQNQVNCDAHILDHKPTVFAINHNKFIILTDHFTLKMKCNSPGAKQTLISRSYGMYQIFEPPVNCKIMGENFIIFPNHKQHTFDKIITERESFLSFKVKPWKLNNISAELTTLNVTGDMDYGDIQKLLNGGKSFSELRNEINGIKAFTISKTHKTNTRIALFVLAITLLIIVVCTLITMYIFRRMLLKKLLSLTPNHNKRVIPTNATIQEIESLHDSEL